jgi:hypothetical protein
MLYDTNVGPFIGKQVFMDRKMEKEPLFLTCIKRSGSFVIVMKYQTDKVSSEDGIINLFVGFSC